MGGAPRTAVVASDDRTALEDEIVGGVRMVVLPLTPYLHRAVARAAAALRATLSGTVVRERPVISAGPAILVRPHLGLWLEEGTGVPDVVIEFRVDSTDRYALGIKRLAYQQAGVGAYWFLEPITRTVRLLRRGDGGDLSWPPVDIGPGGEIITPSGDPLSVDALLPPRRELADDAHHSHGSDSDVH